MESMVGSHDPDVIDTESNNARRDIVKLEKNFTEPAPKRLADNVKATIAEFRERMPVIMTLGNPGLKARHWELVSEIVGFPIKVDSQMTLSKVPEFFFPEVLIKIGLFVKKFIRTINFNKKLDFI